MYDCVQVQDTWHERMDVAIMWRRCLNIQMHREKRSTQKLSSDNLKRNSNLEDLNIDKQGDNETDDSVCIGYEVYNIWTGFIFLWTKRNSKASVEYWIP